MKTIDLSAFQLSKEERKKITGGDAYRCNCREIKGEFTVSSQKTISDNRLGEIVFDACGQGGGNCYKI